MSSEMKNSYANVTWNGNWLSEFGVKKYMLTEWIYFYFYGGETKSLEKLTANADLSSRFGGAY